ncbi:MAG: hypothetical protein H6594_02460 [Flavobacteriales bacterium]|nr:hypothetical protein [Flavobacteriales bacterium]
MRKMKGGAMLCAVMLTSIMRGQGDVIGQRSYPERLHEDIDLFQRALHEVHADPYRYATRAGIDRLFRQVKDSIDRPMTALDLMRELRPVLHAIADAHTYLEPPAAYEDALAHDLPMIPLAVRLVGGELYVQEELKGFRSIPPGSRIISINGRPGREIVDHLFSFTVGDGSDSTYRYRMVEQGFPQLYRTWIDGPKAFKVQYEDPSGGLGEKTIFPLSGDQIANAMVVRSERVGPWSSAYYADQHTTWCTLNTFDPELVEEAGIKPDRFIDDVRRDLRKNNSRVLVIDVRDAGGADLAMAETVFALIAQQPYRVVQNMQVRSVERPEGIPLNASAEAFYSTAHASYLPCPNGAYDLRPDDPRLEKFEPSPKAFDGKVYVVCNGLTREAAAAFVMMAERSGRARIVGEETGTNCISSCGGRELVVTGVNSGVRFHIPLIRYVYEGTPSGPLDHGELPDHSALQQPWALQRGADAVRNDLLQMIQELQ